ncbi:hypothetical protein ACFL5U_01350 [Candidatus Margulisiibacteriota bacterium]
MDSETNNLNILTIDGITFRTSGNIVFESVEDNPFHLAQSQLLEKIDALMENGMQMLMKKFKKR